MERSKASAATALVVLSMTLGACSGWPPPKDPLFRHLVAVVTDDYMGHDLLEEGQTLALLPTVLAFQKEGFFVDFAVLPYVDHQWCGNIQVPIAGTSRPGHETDGFDSYWLKRPTTWFSPAYAVAFDVDRTCRVVRARGWKVMPNTF